MKNKKGIIFGLILAVVVLAFYIKEKNKEVRTSQIKVVKEENKKLKLGVLQLLSHPALDEIYRGLIEELARQGYKNGENLEIDFQNAQGDQSNLAAMSEKIVENRNDIIVGITTPATLSLANVTKEIPIVMGGITYPVEAGIIEEENRPGNNITGISDRTPIKEQLELMREILPDLKKLGVLYTSSEDNSVKQVEEVKKAADELKLNLKIASVSSTNDVQQVTESLASEVEAIFIPIDNTIASTMQTVVKVADEFKVGVFPSADTMVADGGVLGLGVDQYQIGVKTAEVVIEIINGANPAETPIRLANQGIIYLNENKAENLGIKIPANIKEKAKIIGK
ncbi:tryptophan ABC transporter substrate-binding protein [Fusobacterium russii]|uniref:tryptophan ABC transporter substrate-binding protein n=1 Tax=Fusobacterium russii TaxID=854 RepID=UPI0003A50A99|nr:tryptophan ABC transporter substrate-binding protein [Fusobacterium russii]